MMYLNMYARNSLIFGLLALITLPSWAEEESFPYAHTDTMVVTATREEKPKSDIAESVTLIDEAAIQAVSPSHPSEILNRVSGVHVNNLGGEGHMTAIRQPITTRGVYLYLEDGVPVRPTGFFNHNALYEVNIPQSGNIEVVKGPGSALYGSDAIGGMINSLTVAPPEERSYLLNIEAGSYGWKRVLVSGGDSFENHGVNVSLNVTDNEGYRDESEYDRASLTSRWDYHNDQFSAKTLLSYTEVNQSGVSSLEEDDYKNNTKKNRFHGDIGSREVEALRLSSELIFETQNASFSVIPFYRHNTMTMSPSWMVTYDPNVREYYFESFGMLSKYRYNINDENEFIVGFDVDYSPSTFEEEAVSHTLDEDIYVSYEGLGNKNYDFEAEQTSLSPYIQYENRWQDKLITTLGIRYDYFRVKYEDQLNSDDPESIFIPQLGRPTTHLRPDDQTVEFDQVSPKVGLVYQFNDRYESYFNYRHAFTIPSVSTLFRSGSTQNSDELNPIKADSFEIGIRGRVSPLFNYEIAVYHMQIEDDIVTVINGFERNVFNAGETEHQGIEFSFNGELTEEFAYAIAYARTKQTYEKFSYTCCFPSQNIDVSGNDVGKAPEDMGNVAISYRPLAVEGLTLELEWEHLGEYFTDETNTQSYDGHDLYNLRVAYNATDNIEIYGRVQNLTDELYSTYTSNQVGNDNISYRPGLPRTLYAGFKARF
ncbi:MAG: TonB-dependent receptor [Pseudomonadales bacterium]|nr:TonB-dependent receptor [Pseudomonadales bacterium]